ncbi:SpoIIE family protein phosphatase [Mangrovibacterium lignilyticum]|uniref:SpoIIE family protein phosphatase n=1 Tax=Mangrovibacterium lignilyticum TaxID=2668052 RepID=UPI0013D4287B|nr:SpoIIE family protein phosphatase [Mangrovibacterium lignilyticum]
MVNRSIAFQLSFYILTTVTIMVALGVYLNYNFSKQILMQKIEENAVHQSDKVTNEIAHYVITAQEVTRNVSSQIPYYNAHDGLEPFLTNVLKMNPILSGFRIELPGEKENRYLSVFNKGQNELLVLHEKKYCQFPNIDEIKSIVKNEKEGLWSDPFYCPLDTSLLVISFTKAIRTDDGKLFGYISGQINLNFLRKIVSGINIEKGGVSIILSQDGTFLTHPNPNWVMKKNIYDVPDKIFPVNRMQYESLLRSHQQGSGFAYPEMFNYERSWFHFAPVPYTYWTIAIIIPAKKLFLELDQLLRKIILLSAAGLLVILLIIFLITRKMLSPLSAIAKSIKRLSTEDIRLSDQRNEIQILSSSLNDLQLKYTKHLNEQNQSKKDRRKIEKDLKSAKEIQTAIIPAEFKMDPKHPQIELFASLDPAETIGGDLYDYFFIDSDHLLFTMGDVSGKGIPAALFMAVAHTMIKSKSNGLDAHQIIEQVNNELSLQNSNQNFLTLFLGILNVRTGEISYCNAAHNYPYILTRNNEVRVLDKTHGLPIGVYSSKAYSGDSGILKAGDRIILYTDGVTDCRNEKGEFFGSGNLFRTIQNLPDVSAKESTQFILNRLFAFRGHADQSDDISLMVIRYKG